MTAANDTEPHYEGVGADGEPLIPFDVREQSGRRSLYVLGALIVGLLILALIVFFIYQPGTRDRDSAPRIAADSAPFKVEPENPGGLQTPNQDKVVYDRAAGKDIVEDVTPAPGPEAPIEMPKSANIQVKPPAPVTDAPKASSPEPKPATPKVTNPAPTKPAPSTSTASGGYVVQVASVRNRADAVALWSKVSDKFSRELPSGVYSDIRQVDLGDKGIYYRLRVAGLPSKDAATTLCNTLKARGQACLVARK